MKNLLKSLVIIQIIQIVSANLEKLHFQQELYRLVKEISLNYFKIYKCVTFIADEAENANYLERKFPIFIINLSVQSFRRQLLTESFEQGCGGYIIQTSPKKRLYLASELVQAKNEAEKYRNNWQKYLFLPSEEKDTDLEVLLDSEMYYLTNSLFISSNRTGKDLEFVLNGHTIFDPSGSGHTVVDIWSSLEKKFKRGENLFPDKVADLKGKKLIFSLHHYVPYSFILRQDDGSTIYDGLDMKIALELAKYVNASWTVLEYTDEMWGTKFPNGSGNGVFGSVQSRLVDLGFGAFYQWYCDVLDCCYPYIESKVTCLVPKPQIMSGWMTIILPLSMYTWISVSAAVIISCVFLSGLQLIEKQFEGANISKEILPTTLKTFYTVFRLQILQIPKIANKNSVLAVYIKISCFYYFLTALFWQGGIASILTVPRYEDPINTPQDLVSRWPKMEWGAVHIAWVNSIENSTDPVLSEIVKKFVVLDRESIMKRTKTRDFGFFMEVIRTGLYGFNDFLDEGNVVNLRLMEDNIYTAFGIMLLPRGSPFTEKLNHLIHWMYATGVIQKMETQVYLDRMNNHLQAMIRTADEKKNTKVLLAVRHIEGPIYIYLTGILLSVATLGGEILIHRIKTRTKFEDSI